MQKVEMKLVSLAVSKYVFVNQTPSDQVNAPRRGWTTAREHARLYDEHDVNPYVKRITSVDTSNSCA